MDFEPGGGVRRRSVLGGLAAALAAGGCVVSGAAAVANPAPRAAREPKSSRWAAGMSSRIRLVEAGAVDADGLQVAVIEIALDKGFKTYWRHPGDSGIPPTFVFDGSENARDIAVHFPAPVRFDDGAGGHSIGYKGPTVELPVTFRAIDAAKPVKLALQMDYAVCEKICVPASGAVALTMEPARTISPRALALVAALPVKQKKASSAPLSITDLAKGPAAEHFTVEARLPEGAAGELFVEAPSPWHFEVRGGVTASAAKAAFTVLAVERDKSPDCRGVELTLTLAAGNRAIETTAWLDVALLQA